MTLKSKANIITDADTYLPDNTTEQIDAGDVRDRIKDIADSFLNLQDGGLVVGALAGYSTTLTPSNDMHFATKKYVDDGLSGVSPVWGSITGTVTDQTDLTTYLSTNYAKLDGTNQPFTGSIIIEPTSGTSLTLKGSTSDNTTKALSVKDSSNVEYFNIKNDKTTTLLGTYYSNNTDSGFGTNFWGTNSNNLAAPGVVIQNDLSTTSSFVTYGSNYALVSLRDSSGFMASKSLRLFSDASLSSGGTNKIFVYAGGYDENQIHLTVQNNQNSIVVKNGLKVGSNTDSAATAGGGSIRYNSSTIQFSDGSNWSTLATTSELSGYAKLDGSNTPFTGAISINYGGHINTLSNSSISILNSGAAKGVGIEDTTYSLFYENIASGFLSQLTFAEPTANRTLTLPNASGTLALTSDLTNYQPLATNLTSLSGLTYASTSFVKMTAAGTFALDTNTYASSSDLTAYAKLDGTNTPFTGAIRIEPTSGTALTLKGAGTTSATKSVSVSDSAGTEYFYIRNDKQILLKHTSGGAVVEIKGSTGSYLTLQNTGATGQRPEFQLYWGATMVGRITGGGDNEMYMVGAGGYRLQSATGGSYGDSGIFGRTNILDFWGNTSVNFTTGFRGTGGSGVVRTTFTTSTGLWNYTGTAQNLLTIANGIKIGNNTDSAGTAGAGSIKYVSSTLQFSDASNWLTVATLTQTQTLTNKRITQRVGTTTSSATPTINTDNVDYYSLTAQAVDITSFTTNLSGTPTDGQKLWISITGTAARAITWGASFEASTIALPTTTVTTNRLDVGFIWNAATSKWRCVGVA